MRRLVGDDADRAAAEPGEADDDVLGVLAMHLEEVALVDDRSDQLLHVVGLVRVGRDQPVERLVAAIEWIVVGDEGGILQIVARNEAEQLTDHRQTGLFVGRGEMRHAALGVVSVSAAEVLHGDFLVSHGLDDLGAGDEHETRLLDHQDEVGHHRGVHRAAGAGPHDRRNLRHDARRENVANEDVSVAGEADHAFLDPCPCAIVEADHRRAGLHGEVHDLDHLLGEGARQAAAEHREVLREDVDEAAVDLAVAGDHAVAENLPLLHTEVGAAMGLELVDLDERAGVEQGMDTLASRQLAGLVLLLDPLLAAAELGLVAAARELLQILLDAHRLP